MNIACLVLAAGSGTRMKSSKAKVLQEVGNLPMISHVLHEAEKLSPDSISVVVSPNQSDLKLWLAEKHKNCKIIIQKEQKGTCNAVEVFGKEIDNFPDTLVILYGDVPMIKADCIKSALAKINEGTDIVVIGMETDGANEYGRLKITKGDKLDSIVEFSELNTEEKSITNCNSGIIIGNAKQIFKYISMVKNDNNRGEYYLTDIIEIAGKNGDDVRVVFADEKELKGVNDMNELAATEKNFQQKQREKFIEQGVKMIDPQTIYFSHDTIIGNDVTIEPCVYFGEGVSIGDNVYIKAFSHIDGAEIGDSSIIGPFARLRPGVEIGESSKIGNFVEIKNSAIGKKVSISHLSYIGDSEIGDRANIGAGSITCNYDGFEKHKTKIGEDVFIGSNSALVAPVVIGNKAVVAAGSVITENVESEYMALARSKQTNKPDGARKFIKKSDLKNKS